MARKTKAARTLGRGKSTKQRTSAKRLLKRWADLAKKDNVLDFDKAQFAFDAWRCFRRDDKATARFFASQLGLAWSAQNPLNAGMGQGGPR